MMVATTQQNLAVAFVVALVVGWAIFLLLSVKKGPDQIGDEATTAPNRRPYLDDDGLEGRRLETAQKAAIAMLLVVVFGMPMYWLREPGRQSDAARGFDQASARRGFILFQPTASAIPEGNIGHFGCGNCHGTNGEGGVANYTVTNSDGSTTALKWSAPALNTVLKRFTEDEVVTIITYGRANTPMPAWGVEGGGPMNSYQILDLVEYLKSIQLSRSEIQEELAKNFAANGLDVNDGADLFDQFCARCHTKGWSYQWKNARGEPVELAPKPGSGAYGPNLTGGDTLRQFPEIEKHLEFIKLGSEFAKPYGARGVGTGRMPGFGSTLTPAQIQAIVDYERTL
jgi:mono/diheme cytochrome c family protein